MFAAIKRAISRFSYLPRTFKLIYEAAHGWTILWVLLLVGQGILPGVVVYLTRSLVNSFVEIIGAGISWNAIEPIIVPGTLMAIALILTEVFRGVISWVRTLQAELVQDYISGLIHQKSIAIDYAFYESSDYYDRLNRARSDASNRSLGLLENSGALLQGSITLITLAAILLPYGAWLPLILIASALPAFYALLNLNRRQHEWWLTTTTDRRWLTYYDLLLTQGPVAAEIRLFKLGSYFQTAYQNLRRRLRTEQMKLLREKGLIRFGATLVGLCISSIALMWMARQVLLGLLTVGDLALFYQIFNRGQSLMSSLLTSLGQIYSSGLFLNTLFEFLWIEPQIASPSLPKSLNHPIQSHICFKDVTFQYHGSQSPVLEEFNLTIPAGKIVAIVGDNGAGKSTLIKLLCRFYDPDSGTIEVDGVDLRDLDIDEWRSLLTVLFQSPIPYYVSAAQNIALGDLTASKTPAQIQHAARAAGIHEAISHLPRGYDTNLGKLFPDGAELSGGEWQRLALARSFFRQAPFIILDEPTSAMDPWTEIDWLNRFRNLAKGRTALIITHHFTLAMRADVIHVMRKGQIVESGSHAELLARQGFYARSWSEQMQMPLPEEHPDFMKESFPCP